MNYDPDTAGQAATERSLAILLESRIRCARPRAARRQGSRQLHAEQGAEAYRKLLAQAPPYLDYLIGRARQMDRTTAEGKVARGEFPDALRAAHPEPPAALGMGLAHRPALRVDEPVLREALRRAATERRSEVKPKAELLGPAGKPAERRLVQMLIEAEDFREKLAHEIAVDDLHRGLETERIFEALVMPAAGEKPDAAALAAALEERDRRLLFEILFEPAARTPPGKKPRAAWRSCVAGRVGEEFDAAAATDRGEMRASGRKCCKPSQATRATNCDCCLRAALNCKSAAQAIERLVSELISEIENIAPVSARKPSLIRQLQSKEYARDDACT